jgi:hypothetical protein
MDEHDTLSQLRTELCSLTQRATQARHTFPGLKAADSMATMTMAHDLGVLGQEFINLSVALKQAARTAADESVKARSCQVKKSAARAAGTMIKNGAYRVAA